MKKDKKTNKRTLMEIIGNIIDDRKYSTTKGLREYILKSLVDYRENIQMKVTKVIDTIYSSGTINEMHMLESNIEKLRNGGYGSSINRFENFLSQYSEAPVKKSDAQTSDKRPRLTFYQYSKARDNGMSNAEIRATFRMDTPYQVCGFGRHYAQAKKNKSK